MTSNRSFLYTLFSPHHNNNNNIWIHSMPFRCVLNTPCESCGDSSFIILCVRLDSETIWASRELSFYNDIHTHINEPLLSISRRFGRRMSEHFMSWRRFFWCNTESDKNAFFFLFFSDIYMRNMGQHYVMIYIFSQHHHRHNIGLWAAYYYCWCFIMKSLVVYRFHCCLSSILKNFIIWSDHFFCSAFLSLSVWR